MSSLALFSLNTFGTPSLWGWRRLSRMAHTLNRMAPDVLCLQEIQSKAYYALLQRTLPEIPFQVYHPNMRKPSGGLLTASRRPISHWEYFPFPNRGRKLSIGYADWALMKGALMVKFEVEGMTVAAFNTHLQANYLAGWNPGNSLARIQRDQVHFLSTLVQEQEQDTLVIVCGDFNFPPHTFLYTELIERSGLTDPLAADSRPTYQPFPLVPSTWMTRLDYVLYRAPVGIDLQASVDITRLQDEIAQLPWNRFLTDHFLLKLALSW